MKIMTCAWMLPYMVNDCLMSRSGRNDDELCVGVAGPLEQ